MVEKVFFALDGSGIDKKIDYPYVLISAATLWNGKRFKNLNHHPHVQELFLDSGGFSFFYKSGDYEFKLYQYVNLAYELEPDYVAVMDYPCEPEVSRKKYKTNIERIHQTLDNALKLVDLAPELPWVMVVQGYTPAEYLWCLDLIKERELVTKTMAIGSLCVRKKIGEAWKVIKLVKAELPGWVRLHGFGVDLRFLRNRNIFHALYSTDTAAWKMNNRAHWEPDWKPKGWMPKNQQDKLKNFEKYRNKIQCLLSNYTKQTKLVSWRLRR